MPQSEEVLLIGRVGHVPGTSKVARLSADVKIAVFSIFAMSHYLTLRNVGGDCGLVNILALSKFS